CAASAFHAGRDFKGATAAGIVYFLVLRARFAGARRLAGALAVVVAGVPAAALSAHRRNPPGNALVFAPKRHFGGSSDRLRALPPPRITSSGSSAATRRAITS